MTRRSEILDTAAEMFASSGVRTSLREIADACGIQAGSLYHHFDSKEALIVELVERYQADLDRIAAEALDALGRPDARSIEDRVVALGTEIAACSIRHRAALLLTLYEPPSGAGDELVRVVSRAPHRHRVGHVRNPASGAAKRRAAPRHRPADDGDRLCQVVSHVSLGVFTDVPGADDIAALRCRAMLDGVAIAAPSDGDLDRSAAFVAANATIDSWDKADEDEDDRLPLLRAVARAEFGRRGYEATTIRDIAAAAELSTGTVYRLIGSKEELLASIMRSFTVIARSGWSSVLQTDSTEVEKLDALMWVNINAVDRFSDEYNIQLAWIRESPPSSANLGSSFAARLNDLKSLVAQGIRRETLRVEGRTATIRAWSLFELLWMPENIVRELGPSGALGLARETTLRGARTWGSTSPSRIGTSAGWRDARRAAAVLATDVRCLMRPGTSGPNR